MGGGEEEEEGERILMSTNRLLPEEVEDCQFSEKLSYEERHLIGAMVEKVIFFLFLSLFLFLKFIYFFP